MMGHFMILPNTVLFSFYDLCGKTQTKKFKSSVTAVHPFCQTNWRTKDLSMGSPLLSFKRLVSVQSRLYPFIQTTRLALNKVI